MMRSCGFSSACVASCGFWLVLNLFFSRCKGRYAGMARGVHLEVGGRSRERLHVDAPLGRVQVETVLFFFRRRKRIERAHHRTRAGRTSSALPLPSLDDTLFLGSRCAPPASVARARRRVRPTPTVYLRVDSSRRILRDGARDTRIQDPLQKTLHGGARRTGPNEIRRYESGRYETNFPAPPSHASSARAWHISSIWSMFSLPP